MAYAISVGAVLPIIHRLSFLDLQRRGPAPASRPRTPWEEGRGRDASQCCDWTSGENASALFGDFPRPPPITSLPPKRQGRPPAHRQPPGGRASLRDLIFSLPKPGKPWQRGKRGSLWPSIHQRPLPSGTNFQARGRQVKRVAPPFAWSRGDKVRSLPYHTTVSAGIADAKRSNYLRREARRGPVAVLEPPKRSGIRPGRGSGSPGSAWGHLRVVVRGRYGIPADIMSPISDAEDLKDQPSLRRTCVRRRRPPSTSRSVWCLGSKPFASRHQKAAMVGLGAPGPRAARTDATRLDPDSRPFAATVAWTEVPNPGGSFIISAVADGTTGGKLDGGRRGPTVLGEIDMGGMASCARLARRARTVSSGASGETQPPNRPGEPSSENARGRWRPRSLFEEVASGA
jgi:hypothetical protein